MNSFYHFDEPTDVPPARFGPPGAPPARPKPVIEPGGDVTLPYYQDVYDQAVSQHFTRTVSWPWSAGLIVLAYWVWQHWKLELSPMIVYGTLAVLLHELGHYLAMLWFGFRDPLAFFLPIFGWLASGTDEFAPAYRRIAVYLLGPLPGIVLALILAETYRLTGAGWAYHFSFWLILVNLFLTLPVAPFDGGRILHLTLFAHNAWLEAGFTLASIGLIAMVAVPNGWIFVGLFAAMLGFGMLDTFRLGRIADELRGYLPAQRENPPPELTFELCRAITDRVLAVKTTGKDPFNELKPKEAAPVVVDVWRRMIDQPPGCLLALVYLAGLGFTLIIGPSIAGLMLHHEVKLIKRDAAMPGGKVVEYYMVGEIEGRIGVNKEGFYHGPHVEYVVGLQRPHLVYVEGQWNNGLREGDWTYYEILGPNAKPNARPEPIAVYKFNKGLPVSKTTFGPDGRTVPIRAGDAPARTPPPQEWRKGKWRKEPRQDF